MVGTVISAARFHERLLLLLLRSRAIHSPHVKDGILHSLLVLKGRGMPITGGNLGWIIYLILFYKMCFVVCCAFLLHLLNRKECFLK